MKNISYICGIKSVFLSFCGKLDFKLKNMLEFMTPFFKSKRDVISEKKTELFRAYKWIRENNSTISDEILDLMYNSAKEKIENNPEKFK